MSSRGAEVDADAGESGNCGAPASAMSEKDARDDGSRSTSSADWGGQKRE